MATQVSVTTRNGTTAYTLTTGGRGPKGDMGDVGEVTQSAVISALGFTPATAAQGVKADTALQSIPDASLTIAKTSGLQAALVGKLNNTNAAVAAVIDDDPAATRSAADAERSVYSGGRRKGVMLPYISQRLQATRTKLITHALMLGDSLTAANSTPVANALHAIFGYGGWGYGFTTIHSVTGGTLYHARTIGGTGNSGNIVGNVIDLLDFNVWPSGNYIEIPSGGTVLFNRDVTDTQLASSAQPMICDKIKVAFIKESGSTGVLDVTKSEDLSTWTAVVAGLACSNATTIGAVSTTTITRGSYYIKITNSGSTTVKLIGISAERTSGGMVPTRICQGGRSLVDFTATPPAIINPILSDISSDLVFYKNTDDAATQSSLLQTYYDKINAASGIVSDWIFYGIHPTATMVDVLQQNEIIRGFAESNNQVYFDDYSWLPSYAERNARGWMSDETHQNAAGDRISTEIMVGATMLNGFRANSAWSPYGGLKSVGGDVNSTGPTVGFENYNPLGSYSGEINFFAGKHPNSDGYIGITNTHGASYAYAVRSYPRNDAIRPGWSAIIVNSNTTQIELMNVFGFRRWGGSLASATLGGQSYMFDNIGGSTVTMGIEAGGSGTPNIVNFFNNGRTVVNSFIASNGDFCANTVGTGVRIKSGTNSKIGTGATLSSGTVVIPNASVTANSHISITKTAHGGTSGISYVVTKSAGVSFAITSVDASGATVATDVSVFDWVIIERV